MPTDKELNHCMRLIRREVEFFNGWYVKDQTVDKACTVAAIKVARYLKRKAKVAQ